MLLALISKLRFCFVVWTLSLMVGLAIGRAISIKSKVTFSFLKWFF